MKILYTILAILLTALNTYKYNLPTYLYEISVFDIIGLIALAIVLIISLGKDKYKNVLTKGFLLYNILGCIDSLIDEFSRTSNVIGTSDNITYTVCITISILFMVYLKKVKGEPLL